MFIDKINKIFINFMSFLFNISGPIIGPANCHINSEDVPLGKNFKLRIYTPKSYDKSKVIIYYHGGGWIIGGIRAYERILKYISNNSNLIVIGVEYRKAPDYKYPQALNDAKDSYSWVVENILRNNEKMKIALIGDSAGGNLIIELVDQMMVEYKELIDQIVLAYPVVSSSYNSINLSKNTKPKWFDIIGNIMLKYCLKQYRGITKDADNKTSLATLNNTKYPLKTNIILAQNDPLTFSIEHWKNDSASLSYEIKTIMFPNTYHAFINFSRISSQARRALNFIVDTVKN